MLRPVVTFYLAATIFLVGCQNTPPKHYGMFRQPGWWERRMNRLETWNRRHGYPLDQVKDHAVAITGYTLLGAAIIAGTYYTCSELTSDDLVSVLSWFLSDDEPEYIDPLVR